MFIAWVGPFILVSIVPWIGASILVLIVALTGSLIWVAIVLVRLESRSRRIGRRRFAYSPPAASIRCGLLLSVGWRSLGWILRHRKTRGEQRQKGKQRCRALHMESLIDARICMCVTNRRKPPSD